MSYSLEYVAGLFDGEGWVRVHTPGVRVSGDITVKTRRFPSYQVIAGIAMTHKPVLLAIRDQFGGILTGDDYYRRKNAKNRTIYRWKVASKSAYAFLAAIRPFAVVKLEQVELALELQAHIITHKADMVGPWSDDAYKEGITAHRRNIAERITLLKKVNFNLPVEHGAKPFLCP